MEAYILPTDCILIALDAHMFSHNGYGPGTKNQGLGPGPWVLWARARPMSDG